MVELLLSLGATASDLPAPAGKVGGGATTILTMMGVCWVLVECLPACFPRLP
jgi:hypothetical protein